MQLNAEDIIKKYQAGTCTPQELKIIEYYILYVGIIPQDLTQMEREFEELQSRINKTTIEPKRINWPLRIASMAAAAVAALVFSVWFYNYKVASSRKALRNDVAYKNDIAPGKNTATLTLPNGKTINLSDAKTGVVIGAMNDATQLTYNDGSLVQWSLGGSTTRQPHDVIASIPRKTGVVVGAMNDATQLTYNDGSLVRSSLRGGTTRQPHDEIASIPRKDGIITSIPHDEIVTTGMLTASTPRGGQYQIVLPDGTRVWLNADSKISFPSQFSGKERKILLSGEAYFEVTKDKKRPFTVTTDQQTVVVLGTHFNINAYANDKSTTTTLLEGSVRVTPKEHHPGADRDGVVLKPNQQSALSPFGKYGEARGGKINVKQVDPDDAIAWKNGEFAFNNEPLSSIMQRLARWYDVEVNYQNNEIGNKRLNGTISKFGKLSQILSMLEITGEVHFKIEGRRITVMP